MNNANPTNADTCHAVRQDKSATCMIAPTGCHEPIRFSGRSCAQAATVLFSRHDRLPSRSARGTRQAGFSLVEILLSLGIFAVGITAVVSLFPAAAILQRETTQDVISEMAAQSARSVIETRRLTYDIGGQGNLGFYHPSANSRNTNIDPRIVNIFRPTDRSYPSALINDRATNLAAAVGECDLYWVPFIQDLSGNPADPRWVVRLFVLEADSRDQNNGNYPVGNTNDANLNDPNTFPKVRGINSTASGSRFTTNGNTNLEAGDIVMDNNGNDHVIVNINGNIIDVLNPIAQARTVSRLWYAPAFTNGAASPGRRVVTVEVNVVDP